MSRVRKKFSKEFSVSMNQVLSGIGISTRIIQGIRNNFAMLFVSEECFVRLKKKIRKICFVKTNYGS